MRSPFNDVTPESHDAVTQILHEFLESRIVHRQVLRPNDDNLGGLMWAPKAFLKQSVRLIGLGVARNLDLVGQRVSKEGEYEGYSKEEDHGPDANCEPRSPAAATG